MKNLKIILVILSFISFSSCSKSDDNLQEIECGTHSGNQLYKGPRGGCYYYNTNDNKTYVDECECDC